MFIFFSEIVSLIKFLIVVYVFSIDIKSFLLLLLKICYGIEDIVMKIESKKEEVLNICCNCNINYNEN